MNRFFRDETLRNKVYVVLICLLALLAVIACSTKDDETVEDLIERTVKQEKHTRN